MNTETPTLAITYSTHVHTHKCHMDRNDLNVFIKNKHLKHKQYWFDLQKSHQFILSFFIITTIEMFFNQVCLKYDKETSGHKK